MSRSSYLRRGIHFVKGVCKKVLSLAKGRQSRVVRKENRFLEKLYQDLFTNPEIRRRVEYVLTFNESDPRLGEVLARDERALPGNENFQKNGWYKTMLTRYAWAAHSAQDKRVLDTCSGLGWGAYLVDTVANHVICVDRDLGAMRVAKRIWASSCCEGSCGSVLKLPFRNDVFDVVLAMESLEHFSLEDAGRYVSEMYRVLKPGGCLLGSTPLPLTEEGKRKELAMNPYHLYVFTPAELSEFLRQTFPHVHVFYNNRFFCANK